MTPEVLEIFTPLFCEMEELGQTLDADEFVDATKRLYKTLTVPEKNMLLQTNTKWDEVRDKLVDKPSFHPELNKNSLRIAAKSRPQDEDIADILVRKKLESQYKIHEMQQ